MKKRFDCCNLAGNLVAGCFIFLLLSTAAVRAATRQVLSGQVPSVVANMTPLGRLSATTNITMTIGLPLRNKEALTNLLHDVYNPASPKFHQYLTPTQFAEMFGPTKDDYLTLIGFAKAHGLQILETHPNRTILTVRAPVSTIESVFNVTMNVYQHPTEARTFYAPNVEPSIDIGLSVLTVNGLNNYSLPHPKYHKNPQNKAPKLGSGPFGTYLGLDFRKAYMPGVTLDGTGQSVALLEFDGYFPDDISIYESVAGLPSVTLTNVLLDGFNGSAGGANTEVALDIEMAVAMAPGLSQIIVYEGFIPTSIINRMATDNLARQISCSWGWFPFDSTIDQIFQQYALQGQSFFDASGDDDAETLSILPPSDNPYITQVGGTTLSTLGPGGPYQSETVWNWGGGSGSAGGISFTYPLPTWQQGINMTTNLGSTTMRNYPDVALTADNIFVIADNGQQEDVGGTSAAAPLWAGFLALVNQQAANLGRPAQGFINPAIYAIAKGPGYSSTFRDVTTGDNTSPTSPSRFFAYPGFDLCTGWGSPSPGLIEALVPSTPAPLLFIQTNILSGGNGNGLVDYDECNNLDIMITNAGLAIATGVEGVITTTTPGVALAVSTVSYTSILPGAAVIGRTPFKISTQPGFICGTPVALTLVLKSDQVTTTNLIELPSGTIGAPLKFSNNNTLPIPDAYPLGVYSPVTVSNLTGAIGKVTVSLYITHPFDLDLVLELVSPDGTICSLSENNGFFGQNYGSACGSDATRTVFDDGATNSIVSANPPFIGSYQPQTPLSVYNLKIGTNANGIWQLHVTDDFFQDVGTLQCWSLNVYPEICTDGGGECPGADLSIQMTANPNPVLVGSNLTYTLTASNAGPSTAKGVIINQTLPANVTFVSASSSQGATSISGNLLSCNLGSVSVGATATVTVIVIPTVSGNITSTATVGSPSPDFNPNNNTAALTVSVAVPAADVALTMSGLPNPILAGGNLTYKMSITNNGPFTATGVVLTNILPPNINFVSATTSQGFFTSSGNAILTVLGSIPLHSNVVVTIIVRPTTVGIITATGQLGLDPSVVDPLIGNNSATVQTTVNPAADVAVRIVDNPDPVIIRSNFTYFVTVTNNGPGDATGVLLNQTLPFNAPLVSAVASRGGVNTNVAGSITWNITTLPAGGSELMTLVITAPSVPTTLISSATVSAQQGDANTTNNTFVAQTAVSLPVVTIVSTGATLTSESMTPPNGAIEPGETVTVRFGLQNVGNIPTTNMVATLQSSGGVTFPSGSQTYGALVPGGAPVALPFTFTAAGTNGGTVTATLQLQDGSQSVGTINFSFVLPVVTLFSNTNAIIIPDHGMASVYPSTITLSNLTGFVGKVAVTLSNMNHTYPDDLDIMLVHPSGRKSILMSDAGGGFQLVNVSPTFDRSSASVIPDEAQIVSSLYQPADYSSSSEPAGDLFPTNAPAGPYQANLSAFEGIAANGTWSLYVVDDTAGDQGNIAGGWSVAITTISPVNKVADLAVSGFATPGNQLLAGDTITYTINVTNQGPDAASNVLLTNLLPNGVSFVSAALSQGTYTQTGQTLKFNLGAMAAAANLTLTVTGTVNAAGSLASSLAVGANEIDPNPGNNTNSVTITSTLPPADLAAAISVASSPVYIGSNLVYTLVVTNNGPGTALNVTGSFSLAGGLNLVSAIPSQGNCINNGSVVLCNLGNLPSNTIATVILTVTPSAIGVITNVWAPTSGSTDTNLGNNTASTVVTVNPLQPIITAGVASLLSESGIHNGAIDSGETVTISFALSNVGVIRTTNLVATLQSSGGVSPITTSRTYGQINSGASGSQSFTFNASGVPGGTVTATLSLVDNSLSLGSVTFTFLIPGSATFTSSTLLTIPQSGPASPYPSTIVVSGLNGLVSKATVTISGLSHAFPDDIDMILVSPSGQKVMIMSDVGGAHSLTNVTLTFTDAASNSLPDADQITSGTYLPTDFEPGDVFPGLSGPPTGSTLSAFNGFTPNGTWSLYVVDDTAGDAGFVTNWSLALTAATTVNPSANLSVSMVASPNPVFGGDYLNYSVVVANDGPATADNVVLTDTLPAGTTLVSVSPSQGTVNTNIAGTVSCALGSISAGGSAAASIRIQTGHAGSIVNTASVTSDATDLYTGNNSFAATTTVVESPSANLLAATTSGGLRLTLLGQPFQPYAIQICTNLVSPGVWSSITTNTAGSDGTFIYSDSSTNAPRRFYRAMRLPQ